MAANLESWTTAFEFYLKQNGRQLPRTPPPCLPESWKLPIKDAQLAQADWGSTVFLPEICPKMQSHVCGFRVVMESRLQLGGAFSILNTTFEWPISALNKPDAALEFPLSVPAVTIFCCVKIPS
jgi:hypothetical protein